MSAANAKSAAENTPTERRAHRRKRLEQLAYIGFGPNSGGVLLDVSEQGLRCQIVGAVVEGDSCRLKFCLPGHHSTVEADGQVVWSNETKQGGGVRLLGLSREAQLELQQWVDQETEPSAQRKPAQDPPRMANVSRAQVPKAASATHTLARPTDATKKASRPSATARSTVSLA